MSDIRQGIRVKRCPFPADGVEVLLFQEVDGKLQTANHIDFVPCQGAMVSHNMTMSQEDAEHLLLDLWEAGIRVPAIDAEIEAKIKEAVSKLEAAKKEDERRKEEDRRREQELNSERKSHMDDLRNVAMGLIKCLQPKQP